MNKRLRELVRKAGLDDSDFPIEDWDNVPLSKFAQLIVQECLAQADKIRDGCEVDDESQQALGADWAGLAIARHFGVES